MSVRAVRDTFSRFYAQKWQSHDGYWLDHYPRSYRVYASMLERRNAAIVAAIPDGLHAILDLGCGVGDLMLPLSRKSGTVVGVDIATANLLQARKNLARSGVTNAALIQSGAETLPFLPQSLDAVVMADVIEHIPDIEGALREVRRVLRPGGVFVCVTPHAHVLNAITWIDRIVHTALLFLLRRRRTVRERVYERFLTKAEVETALRKAGFAARAYRRICFYPGQEGGGVLGVLMHNAHRVLGDRRFLVVARVLTSGLSLIERMRVFNQKQIWVARP